MFSSSYMFRHNISILRQSSKCLLRDAQFRSSHVVSSTWCVHHATRHNAPIHNILSTAPQLSISHKELGTLPEDGNVMPKHVGATIHN
jgi:hypothetical protein